MFLKRKSIFAFLIAVLFLSFSFALTACGDKKLPTTAYEKIAFAFDGVEESFRTNSSKNDSMKTASADSDALDADFTNALNVIRNVYVSGDNQGDVIDDLEYDQAAE